MIDRAGNAMTTGTKAQPQSIPSAQTPGLPEAFPEGFGDLEKFSAWALGSQRERSQKRRDSTLPDLEGLYSVMISRIHDALRHLDQYPLHAMPPAEQRLLYLAFAFAEIAPFVEQYHRTILPEVFDERRLVPVHDL